MRLILALTAAVSLAGCAKTPLMVETKPLEQSIAQPNDPRAPVLKDVKWNVLTKDTASEFIDAQSRRQGSSNPVFIAITVQDYQVLSTDLAELKRYIDQQNSVIVYYRNATAKKAPASNK
jgi:hypothetical protein